MFKTFVSLLSGHATYFAKTLVTDDTVLTFLEI